jgi:nucleotide-binding universal stress UspA family protein
MSTDSGGRIERHAEVVVVGVDGSPNSAAALRWAARYAGMADPNCKQSLLPVESCQIARQR